MQVYDLEENIRLELDCFVGSESDVDYSGGVELEKKEQVLSLSKYVKECEFNISGMKDAEQSIAKRRKSLERKVDRLKEYILTILDGKVSDSFVSVSTRKSEKVVVSNDFDCDEYMVEKTTRAPDKIKIKDDLRSGVVIDGASLEKNINLVIK